MRFIADNTVGKLRRWLSLVGYDITYDPRSAREILHALRELENVALKPAALKPAMPEQEPVPTGANGDAPGPQSVIVLGRYPTLAEEEAALVTEASTGTETSTTDGVPPGRRFFHIASPRLSEQIAQVTRAFPMDFGDTLFSRCTCCNLELIGPLPLEAVAPKVPALVREWRAQYYRCPRCERVYWDGTHTEHVRAFLRDEAGLSL